MITLRDQQLKSCSHFKLALATRYETKIEYDFVWDNH